MVLSDWNCNIHDWQITYKLQINVSGVFKKAQIMM